MMEKTIEEKWKAVCDELVAIRDEVGYRGSKSFDWVGVTVVEFELFVVGAYKNQYAIRITEMPDPSLVKMIYSGLGLEARDQADAAHARAEKLAEELKSWYAIHSHWWPHITSGGKKTEIVLDEYYGGNSWNPHINGSEKGAQTND